MNATEDVPDTTGSVWLVAVGIVLGAEFFGLAVCGGAKTVSGGTIGGVLGVSAGAAVGLVLLYADCGT